MLVGRVWKRSRPPRRLYFFYGIHTDTLNGPPIGQVHNPADPRNVSMDDLPPGCTILKSLIAPARHSDGPTLYLICQVSDGKGCVVYEQLPDGKSLLWTEPPAQCIQQAEGMIYQRVP